MKQKLFKLLKATNTVDFIIKIFLFSLFLGFVVYGIYDSTKKKTLLSEKSVYVIATFVKMNADAEGAAYPIFQYNYDTQILKLANLGECRYFSLESRFYARIHPEKPEIGEVLYKKPVPDSIIIQPKNGWEKMPNIDKSKIPQRNGCLGIPWEWFEED